jgi:ribonuclease BN (tRNA processing enzyme)
VRHSCDIFCVYRILFDAGEGVQRMCVEHKVRLSKTDKICFTQISAHTVAGAPGTIFCFMRLIFSLSY